MVGVDGGGTSTRCLIATASGEIIARGRAGGANLRSARDPGGNLARALAEAVAGIGPRFVPADVAGGVFGLAGAGEAGRRQASALASEAWRSAGLPGSPVVVSDVPVAFAGATPEPDGSMIIAGTGTVAARIEDRAMVRRCDGYGWLIGDEGSGVWIGRRAVRAALAAIDGYGEPTALASRVLPTLRPGADGTPLSGEALTQAIIAAVYEGEPARLGLLSPVVEAVAGEGDPVALGIVGDAARHLVRTLEAVRGDDAGLPVVLAGSLLTRPTLVAGHVRRALAGLPVVLARDGAAGAAALALRAARVSADPEAAHRRLLAL
ncbi:N-acetylglucosamine kinase [Sphaerisporangium melleum]|uniref:N-acetylglucosamine kinase n=1 Tax=Sphaerisporangium melleum TaxID=321316 RepID=UPI001E3E6508|nr:BadF/BadG/BcrA/BcrD ATPase family protein [Sphaerisporangium melleum]